jgi:signal transduction histidine kinase
LLVSERGDFVTPGPADPVVKEWFQRQCHTNGVADFFSQATGSFLVGDRLALWTPAQIVSGEKWWLVCLHDPKAQMHRTPISGFLGHFLVVGSLLLAGFALAFLMHSLGRRLDDQVQHLEERKQLERQIEEVSEREQRRIGAGLHEDLCQRLTGIEAVSRHLEKRLNASGLPEAGAAADIAAEIKESLAHARQMADELQPVSLLEQGFLAAISELALSTSRRRGVPCQIEDAGFAVTLDPSVASHLYRITQEAINNVIQHARATQIVVRLTASEENLSLAIIDNGTGIGASAASGQGAGMGLLIMRYRSDLIGGQLEVRPEPGGGTLVKCILPVPKQK